MTPIRRSPNRGKLKTIMGQAEMAVSPALNYARDLADAIGLDRDAVQITSRIKDEKRIFVKADAKHEGKIEQLGDITGIRIIFNHTSQVLALRYLFGKSKVPDTDFTRKWEKRGAKTVSRSDHFWEPKEDSCYIGYDVKIEVDLKKGRKRTCEIQMLHENMQLTDQVTHGMFESERLITDTAAADNNRDLTDYEQMMVNNYQTSRRTLYLGDLYNPEYGFRHLLKPGWQPPSATNVPARHHKGSHLKP